MKNEDELEQEPLDDGDAIKCKFCWDNVVSEEDPLLKACSCKGGLSFIHLSCLRSWVEKSVSKEEEKNNTKNLLWKKFACNLCM